VRQVCFILLWAEANGGTPAPLSFGSQLATGGLAAVESGPPVAPWARGQAHPPPGGALPTGPIESEGLVHGVRLLSAVQDSQGAQRVALGSMS